MAIDLMSNTVYSLEDLKSRAMTRLAAHGLGLVERLANVERMVYAHAGAYLPTAEVQAQITAIGQMLIAEEAVYEQEKADTLLLAETLAYESAVDRLALSALVVGGEITQEQVDFDTDQRATAQVVVSGASQAVVALAAARIQPVGPL